MFSFKNIQVSFLNVLKRLQHKKKFHRFVLDTFKPNLKQIENMMSSFCFLLQFEVLIEISISTYLLWSNYRQYVHFAS